MKQDFRLIFKDIMDKDHFESKIYFRDPMTTNLNSFRGARRRLLPPCPPLSPPAVLCGDWVVNGHSTGAAMLQQLLRSFAAGNQASRCTTLPL